MKIVLAGDWHSSVHERPMSEALQRLEHEVHPFAWHTYVRRSDSSPAAILRRAQNKYLTGPLIARINRDLVALADRVRPDLLFVYRGTHILGSTLREIRGRSPRTLLVGYNNDDPFAPGQSRWLWRHFIAAIPAYDQVLAYRPRNVADFERAGASSTGLLPPWFVPDIHRPLRLTPEDCRRYESDVVFVGHFEDDGRLECIAALVAAGVRVRLFGPGRGYRGHDWNGPLRRAGILDKLAPVHEVWGDDYCKALCGARIALCFLSKRNRDAYTRRCFEIPATRTLLLSEYSTELAEIFRDTADAVFFRSPAELVDKASFYLANPRVREEVAANGYRRVFAGGHDVDSRMQQMLEQVAPRTLRRSAG